MGACDVGPQPWGLSAVTQIWEISLFVFLGFLRSWTSPPFASEVALVCGRPAMSSGQHSGNQRNLPCCGSPRSPRRNLPCWQEKKGPSIMGKSPAAGLPGCLASRNANFHDGRLSRDEPRPRKKRRPGATNGPDGVCVCVCVLCHISDHTQSPAKVSSTRCLNRRERSKAVNERKNPADARRVGNLPEEKRVSLLLCSGQAWTRSRHSNYFPIPHVTY